MFDGYSLTSSQIKAGISRGNHKMMKRIREEKEFIDLRAVYKSYASRKTGFNSYKSFKHAWELTFPDDADLSIDTNLIKGNL